MEQTDAKMTREEMIGYLQGHFRYDTMRNWNNSTSYAANMKVRNAPEEHRRRLYDMLDCAAFQSRISDLIQDWDIGHGHVWQAGFNGRSGGYLVLYQGGTRPSDYKSHCTRCGQRNYREATEGDQACGVCGGRRVNYEKPPMKTFCWPGKGTDHGVDREEMEEWEDCQLEERVRTVKDFDRLAEDIKAEAIYMAEKYHVEDEEYQVTETRKVLVDETGELAVV